MSYYSKLKSHPNKNLEEHLCNVASISKNIFNDLSIKDNDLYANLSFFIGITHDFAKSTSFFQDKLLNNIKTEKARHGFLSAVFGYFVIRNYILNYEVDDSIDFASIAFLVILKHHGNLPNIDGFDGELNKIKNNNKIALEQLKDINYNLINNPEYSLNSFYANFDISIIEFLEEYDNLIEEITERLEDLSYEEKLENYFYIILFYSVLLDADKMDASDTKTFNRERIPSNIVDIYKKENFDSNPQGINIIREEAFKEVNGNMDTQPLENRIFSIDLPTGTGKTLTAFSLVLKLKERIYNELGFNPRIIYSLPFLSIIDQNEKVFSNILDQNGLKRSNIILKHNHLSDMSYTVEGEDDLSIDKSKILIEAWNSEIVVTTFIQFFNSLISNRNKALRKFHNIVNSIIILDEVQSIPYPYWEIVRCMLKKLTEDFNSWVIFMTATQPLIFHDDEIIPLVENKAYYYENFDRIDYNFNLEDIPLEDFKDKAIGEIENNNSKSIMFVLNTINSSKELYNHIKEHFEFINEDINLDENGIVHINDEIQLIYLSTNIIPKHRLNRINSIKNSTKRNIIVTTQLIEAGVDISVDIVYRDLAPLDSIIQTAGRCNRNSENERGIVNVVSIVNEKGRRFSSFVYDSILISATCDVINGNTIVSEKEFNMASSIEYYKNLLKYGSSMDSDELFETLIKLDFGEISSKFKLIDMDLEKTEVFIEINEDATEIWERFKQNRLIKNPFDRKNDFLSFKSTFFEYVVSVNTSKLGTIVVENNWLAFVSEDDIKRKYDLETGFIYEDNEDVFII